MLLTSIAWWRVSPANLLGFFSLVAYTGTLIPSLAQTLFPNTRKTQWRTWLLKQRRYIGLTAFALGLAHGMAVLYGHQLDLSDRRTYLESFTGMTMLAIFTLLAMTSNTWSIKRLGRDWKRLQSCTYWVIFLLPWHILDKMADDWSAITPVCALLSLGTLILFLRRKQLEWNWRNGEQKTARAGK